MTRKEKRELLKVRDQLMRDRIEVIDRAGFYEARRPGTAGKVFGRNRDQAIDRAMNWRGKHQVWKRDGQEVHPVMAALKALRKEAEAA